MASEHAFEAAKRGGYRGYFYFPTLEPGGQMPRDTRERIAEKVNWLYNNNGAVQTVIDGLAIDEVGAGIWPKAFSSNPAFNRAVTEDFHNLGEDARMFHSGGCETAYSAQVLIRRSIRLHGEIFGQLLRPGEGSAAPMLHFINAWQCRNGVTQQDQSRWDEGVMKNKLGRAVQYRFITNREATAWNDVSADDVLHFHDYFWNGQARGMSGLAPVVRKLFSLDDIVKAETNGMVLRSRLAYAITKQDDDGAPTLAPGMTETQVIEGGHTDINGTRTTQQFTVQKVISGDNSEVDIADLPAGYDLKMIESARATGPEGFSNFLLTDVAYATKYPPAYVFNLAGATNGTLVRAIQNRVQRIKDAVRQDQLQAQFLRRWYTFFVWQRILAGAYDGVEGGVPSDWYRMKVIMPANDTVDVGREGRLYDERVATGKMDEDSYHGLGGKDGEDVEDAILATRMRREKKLLEDNKERKQLGLEPLRYYDVWPANNTASALATQASAGADAKEEDGE